jgi:multiple sugar transport system permease protein
MNAKVGLAVKKSILFVILFFFAFLVVMPFVLMITGSLKTVTEINASRFSIFPAVPQFSNYPKAFRFRPWGLWFMNSAIVTLTATVVSLLINSMAGYAFARLDFHGRKLLFYSVLLALMVPRQLTILPRFVILRSFPLAGGNNILGQGGVGFVNSYMGLMLPIFAGAFGIFLCRQFYLNFPKSLDDAAEIDGCNVISTFFRIYIPNSQALLVSLGILKCTFSWNDYMWPLTIVQSERMMTVQLGLALFKDETITWETLLAATTVVMLPLIVVFFLAQNRVVSGLVTSGMKE